MAAEKHFSISLGRQLGSGGGEIARFLADKLNFKFYDRELLYAAAVKSGYSTEIFEKRDEEKSEFHSFISNLIPFVGTADYYGNHVDEDALFRILSETIRQIADEENCIFVGRCAEYVLRERKECMLSIFICADTEDRIARLCQLRDIKPEAARKLIQTNDKRRAAFHDFYSTQQWGRAATYDLCINQSRLGMDKTKEFLLEYVRQRFNL
ncbi:MAG: cytidylate kinase-like family protein [Bacteroidaceae bacterium]|nr:cytidylate kinase-like family protein [Bacteroidaceae bacterium]